MVGVSKVFAVSVCATMATALRTQSEFSMNPIRKVVNMLQAMQKKVQSEGEKEEDLFEKFMCYCKNGVKDLRASIDAAEKNIPQLESNIESSDSKLKQTKQTLAAAQESRTAAKAAIAEATAIREKDAAAFAQTKSDLETNIAALGKAITALEKGAGASFLQTNDAQVMHRFIMQSSNIDDYNRKLVAAFLENSSEYAPQSGQITGILKRMLDTMKADLDEATNTENGDLKNYEELVAAKNKEIEGLGQSIEHKTKLVGELGIELVELKEDLEDTKKTYAEDQKYLAELDTGCKTKSAEWEERKKLRAEELVALGDTIKVLNDDDALDLFKGTLGKKSGDSFLQTGFTTSSRRATALEIIRSGREVGKTSTALDLLAVALSGKTDFGKIIKMIEGMLKLLDKEQADDDKKKEYCLGSLDKTEDQIKTLSRDIGDLETEIATVTDEIKTLTDEIDALVTGIKDLDKRVAEATDQRKNENEEYKQLMASNGAAKEILNFAKNRLNKFYNPKLYKPPAKEERSTEDAIGDSFGMERATTPAGGIAGTGVTAFVQVFTSKEAPPPPPETFGAYSKKSSENTGVIAMIDLLIADLVKEMTEAKTAEKDAQADYETLMQDSKEKRVLDSESVTNKKSAKADAESRLGDLKEDKTKTDGELMATEKNLAALHGECDWNVKNHDARKEARANEADAMKNAVAALKGAK